MPTTIKIDPITRIEGHLYIEVTIDTVRGQQQVVEAKCGGTMYRGFETIMIGRDPRDASLYTQRICGVCPVSHSIAASQSLDAAFGITPPENGRILRNLILGANYIQSHLLHFYHLSALDYIDTTGLLDFAPYTPRYVRPDMASGATAQTLVSHYLAALTMRRKAHQMAAIFSGKIPMTASIVVGGVTEQVTQDKINDFRALLTELRAFIDGTYVPDAQALGSLFPDYYSLGAGPGNLLAFGVFDLDASGNRFFPSGIYVNGQVGPLNPAQITEYVKYGWFTPGSGGLHPSQGITEPDPDKQSAYTWLKAPRYNGQPFELGPLARMRIRGDYTNGISAMDRIVARALETKIIADAMDAWLNQLAPGAATYTPGAIPQQASGAGMIEAPRGALGHWMDVENSVISRYQVITPTSWNSSPRDDFDVPGPTEAALVGVPVDDFQAPLEVIRVVHTFDPCLACAVHMIRPGQKEGVKILIPPSVA